MPGQLRVGELHAKAIGLLNSLAAEKLKELLETKHLYQKVSFDCTDVFQRLPSEALITESTVPLYEVLSGLTRQPLALGVSRLYSGPRGQEGRELAMLRFQNVKLYCLKCERPEAFAPIWFTDSTNDMRASSQNINVSPAPLNFQLITAIYQCQSCKGMPEAFLIRRLGWELQLHGRSPMEGIEVPKYIPKQEYSLFRDSVIAFNSGKILAALFYLRSFIEQFARRVTGVTGKMTGEEIMDSYNETIPPKHRDSMPSLRLCYGNLSAPIHGAKDDVEVFQSERETIEKHFEIRKVFDIPETLL